jgi:hypothetical protein
MIPDLAALEVTGLLRPDPSGPVFDRPDVNAFMALGVNRMREEPREKVR